MVLDIDGDGYGHTEKSVLDCTQPLSTATNNNDCDDDNYQVSPIAKEVCDTIDNNCDGQVNESTAEDAQTIYLDLDEDTYGNPIYILSCDVLSGYALDSSDCDDSNPDVSPKGTEICDGIDNDCNNSIDEPTAIGVSTWYYDNDGDGYGDTTNSLEYCDQPSNYVSLSGDCDDGNDGCFS